MIPDCGHDHGEVDAPTSTAAHRADTSLSAKPFVALVRMYQHARAGRPSPCRFVPSCSTYAAEALQEHGAVKGAWLSMRRLSRCHPWGAQGYDPVPPRSLRSRSTWNTAADTPVDPPPDQKAS